MADEDWLLPELPRDFWTAVCLLPFQCSKLRKLLKLNTRDTATSRYWKRSIFSIWGWGMV